MIASAVVDIRKTYGANFIGLLVSVALFGMTIIQGWIFFINSRKDPMSLKLFVAVLLALDVLHTVLCTYVVYWYLVSNFGNVNNLGIDMWAANIQVGLNALTVYLVQLFYARRVYFISRNIIIPVLVAVLGGLCFVLASLFTAKAFILERYSRFDSLIWVCIVAISAAASADILIAGSMCWYLYHQRTAYGKTNSIITTLMAYSINSGLLTSILATTGLVAFVIESDTSLIWEAILWTVCKCYVNSLLAMLNSRGYLRERVNANNSIDGSALSSVQLSQVQYRPNRAESTTVTFNIRQPTTTDFAGESHDYDTEPIPLELRKLQVIATSELAV